MLRGAEGGGTENQGPDTRHRGESSPATGRTSVDGIQNLYPGKNYHLYDTVNVCLATTGHPEDTMPVTKRSEDNPNQPDVSRTWLLEGGQEAKMTFQPIVVLCQDRDPVCLTGK